MIAIALAKKPEIQHKLVSPSPNLSLILPGPCNAHCDFCFWSFDATASKSATGYASKVAEYLDLLPDSFAQVSVTGGEPTISPVFDDIMKVLSERKKKISKVVLTTNGVRLLEKREQISGVVNHINISRHHVDDEKNNDIFKSKTCPNTEKLKSIIKEKYGTADICFNCVVPPTVTAKFCEEFITYTKKFKKVAAVNFRIYHNSMDACKAQFIFENKYGRADISRCPVCRVAAQFVRGLYVNWKYSILEPTQSWDGIYELIVQPTGILSADWDGKIIIDPVHIDPYEVSIEEEMLNLEKELWP